jgi:hypothetical protein
MAFKDKMIDIEIWMGFEKTTLKCIALLCHKCMLKMKEWKDGNSIEISQFKQCCSYEGADSNH